MQTAASPGMVSVIMPFLNTRESFLLEAVQSICAQTYNQWELILIDDGSEPSASEYALRIANEHADRIRVVDHEQHQNLGISASRNKGLSVAKGEYIAFLDADDIWSEEQLAEQVDLLQQHPTAALLYGNTSYWFAWEEDISNPKQDLQYKMGLRTRKLYEPPKILSMILQRRAISPCMTSVMARRQIFEDGVTFEEDFRQHYEDQVFIAKVFVGYPVYVADKCWGKYRQHPESVTAEGDDSETARAWRLRYLRWLSGYLREKDLQGTAVWYALTMELRMLQNQRVEKVISTLRDWRRKCRKALGMFNVA